MLIRLFSRHFALLSFFQLSNREDQSKGELNGIKLMGLMSEDAAKRIFWKEQILKVNSSQTLKNTKKITRRKNEIR